jgi:hypothetical protein
MEYGLGEYDADHIDDVKIGFNTNDEEEEDDNSDNVRTDRFEENKTEINAREGFLAQEMWKAYKDWLSNRPEELEQFEKFMVRSCSFIVFIRHAAEY